mmetsp:Transcript_33075/g.95787  ORF Transcript_33075/g.95787 Transcript_33075/m.95787 type:complete len:271 (-) Transcript_33075:238-1050(-)
MLVLHGSHSPNVVRHQLPPGDVSRPLLEQVRVLHRSASQEVAQFRELVLYEVLDSFGGPQLNRRRQVLQGLQPLVQHCERALRLLPLDQFEELLPVQHEQAAPLVETTAHLGDGLGGSIPVAVNDGSAELLHLRAPPVSLHSVEPRLVRHHRRRRVVPRRPQVLRNHAKDVAVHSGVLRIKGMRRVNDGPSAGPVVDCDILDHVDGWDIWGRRPRRADRGAEEGDGRLPRTHRLARWEGRGLHRGSAGIRWRAGAPWRGGQHTAFSVHRQ